MIARAEAYRTSRGGPQRICVITPTSLLANQEMGLKKAYHLFMNILTLRRGLAQLGSASANYRTRYSCQGSSGLASSTGAFSPSRCCAKNRLTERGPAEAVRHAVGWHRGTTRTFIWFNRTRSPLMTTKQARRRKEEAQPADHHRPCSCLGRFPASSGRTDTARAWCSVNPAGSDEPSDGKLFKSLEEPIASTLFILVSQ